MSLNSSRYILIAPVLIVFNLLLPLEYIILLVLKKNLNRGNFNKIVISNIILSIMLFHSPLIIIDVILKIFIMINSEKLDNIFILFSSVINALGIYIFFDYGLEDVFIASMVYHMIFYITYNSIKDKLNKKMEVILCVKSY